MGTYTCTKSATFAGVKYKPGDAVPAEAIPANRIDAMIGMGLIAKTQQAEPEATAQAGFTVPIVLSDGTVERLEVTPETVEEAVAVLQMTTDGAAEHIGTMTDANALVLIDACESRKTVKKAAADRAATLNAAEDQNTAEGE